MKSTKSVCCAIIGGSLIIASIIGFSVFFNTPINTYPALFALLNLFTNFQITAADLEKGTILVQFFLLLIALLTGVAFSIVSLFIKEKPEE